jgi:cysteine/glycine-rich protein
VDRCRIRFPSRFVLTELSPCFIPCSGHVQCFTCLTCKTRLSSTTLTEKDGELYCQTCYAKQFGPKGYGIGSQSLTFTGISVAGPASGASASPPAVAPRPAAAASPPAAAVAASPTGKFCTSCGTGGQTGRFCGSCGKPVGGAVPSASPPAPVAAAPAPASSPVPNPSPVSSPPVKRPGSFVAAPSQKCGACNQTVYEAEKVAGGGRVWHSACFRCASCRTGLSSSTLNDKDGKIYCNACYGKLFGPKGFGFAGGAAGLMSQ